MEVTASEMEAEIPSSCDMELETHEVKQRHAWGTAKTRVRS
jgi:hypothetical protein